MAVWEQLARLIQVPNEGVQDPKLGVSLSHIVHGGMDLNEAEVCGERRRVKFFSGPKLFPSLMFHALDGPALIQTVMSCHDNILHVSTICASCRCFVTGFL